MGISRSVRRVIATSTAAAALAATVIGGSAAPASAAVTATRANASPIAIPDSGTANPYPSTINASGLGTEISKLTVELTNVTHGCVKDLDVLLVGPDGTKTTLMSDNGEVAINFSDCNNLTNKTIVFDDDAGSWGTSVPGGNPITFRPSDNDALGHQGDDWPGVGNGFPAANLSIFNGKNPNGAWNLYVVDDAGDDSGSIAGGWKITVTTVNGPPTATNQAIDAFKGVPKLIGLGGTDPDGDALTCQPTLGATPKGTVTGGGCLVTYTAATRAQGSDSFSFRVRDTANTQSAPGTVSVSIINRNPVGTDQTVSVPAGSTIPLTLGGTDPDPGESLTLTCGPELGETESGKGNVSGTGCNVNYRAKPGSTGTDEFDFTVADGFGGLATGTVTVNIGPATLPGCTPTDTKVARYVCRVYLDMLGRSAEPSGKQYWIDRINSGEPRYAILNSFSRTNEYRTRQVKTAYLTFLGRAADQGSIDFWKERLKNTNPDVMRASLLGSPEFQNRAGGLPGWAPAMYQLVLRRPATQQEAAAATAAVTTGGKTRQQVATELLGTPAADTVTTQAIYEAYLRRTPPGSEVGFWVGRLQSGTFETIMVVQIVASAEYYDKA